MALKTPVLYTVREVADALRVHPRTAYRLIKEGKLSGVKVGSQWRVPEISLMKFIETGGEGRVEEKKSRKDAGPTQLTLPMQEE